jgi:hypothetical protein
MRRAHRKAQEVPTAVHCATTVQYGGHYQASSTNGVSIELSYRGIIITIAHRLQNNLIVRIESNDL